MTRQQLLQIEQELEQSYFERNEEIHSSLTALLSKQHCLLLGPPGTAKSQLIRDLCERIGGNYFQWLLKVSEELAKLQTTPTTAQTLIEAQAKVNAYTAEILEKLLGLSPTPSPKRYA